jgi:hypothetical protein
VSLTLSTASGLKLGLGRPEVESILGKPDLITGDRFVYARLVQRKTTPEEFERMRKEYSQKLSDREAHEKFDSYDVGLYIETGFSNSRLNYLVVSMTGTADG